MGTVSTAGIVGTGGNMGIWGILGTWGGFELFVAVVLGLCPRSDEETLVGISDVTGIPWLSSSSFWPGAFVSYHPEEARGGIWGYRGHWSAFMILNLGLSSEAERRGVLWVYLGACEHCGQSGLSCFSFSSGTLVRGHDEKTDKLSVGLWVL